MHILITGGTGFIGSYLTKHFLSKNYKVTIMSRRLNTKIQDVSVINHLNDINSPVDIFINLAGYPLDKKRWNEDVKKEIYESRISTTKKLVEYINNMKSPPQLLITASAIRILWLTSR
jgi:NAD dependent epimerase/dehydratase family enzyme